MGQTCTQEGLSQWLHCLGRLVRQVYPSPRSTSQLSTQTLKQPTGTSFYSLQATAQALHPMQRVRSINIPKRFSMTINLPYAFSIL